ncbi:DUF4191 domain-containing protein [Gordonia rubripertincta]|uniref:DUF4191 domain-containing protein n=2 Tax=Gordonia rubripertincta TaxID=36822 RepID=A0AAW6R2Q8_GORRU|nr:DUF4191 domain-containing protein [Gordonia rubripertincta]MBM7278228.1 DUF4191 domain-containing protein [Gordonia rubripertincta]MDG6779617.1 DUF4191 domain-containing protein [Gordonia rubripertincta]NKY62924.1 DUF4191 domain-containing protein [Gordonia rubripertincta]QMU19149.1 DUF4191 domain-containing protein [Gordonia rubripertincta]TSD98521.1 DUF4191 domain-containing protein [Gordonia rubripertincta]
MAKAQSVSKEAKAAKKQARKAASKERRQQLWQAFQMQRKEDKRLIPYMVGVIVLSIAVFTALGFLLGSPWLLIPLGVVLGVLGAFILFGRRVQKNVYTKAEGQPGAAGWALGNMRGQWRVAQAVSGTSHLDAVHRVIGKPGVILVGEGSPTRVKSLLNQEKKKAARVVGDTPIYEIMVGNDDGQVPLSKLERHINKLPSNIDRKRMETLEGRLAALSSKAPGPGMPKGPLPGNAKMKSMQRTARRRG